MLKMLKGGREQLVEELRETLFAGVLASSEEERQACFTKCVELDRKLSIKGKLKPVPVNEDSHEK